jgi:hypothetical protein
VTIPVAPWHVWITRSAGRGASSVSWVCPGSDPGCVLGVSLVCLGCVLDWVLGVSWVCPWCVWGVSWVAVWQPTAVHNMHHFIHHNSSSHQLGAPGAAGICGPAVPPHQVRANITQHSIHPHNLSRHAHLSLTAAVIWPLQGGPVVCFCCELCAAGTEWLCVVTLWRGLALGTEHWDS